MTTRATAVKTEELLQRLTEGVEKLTSSTSGSVTSTSNGGSISH